MRSSVGSLVPGLAGSGAGVGLEPESAEAGFALDELTTWVHGDWLGPMEQA